ncbi:MAG: UDP-N-acetylglucosamine 2-epimerase (non-hydrolyzing) [Verrucomicrobia bacterium]|nr:UDP-N-acetylglucosamine 2-epimerase (non-hydrolyzing) [Verrucomicrobiota bacterium]
MRTDKIKVMCVVGTRPEAIKLAPVIRALQERAEVDCQVCFSGQHLDMGLRTLRLFEIEPDHVLETMRQGQSLAWLNARLLGELDNLYEAQKPDWVVVQGDTTTAFAAAQAAFYRRIRVAHVEAGLRTHDRFSPFPEEINRVFISRIADLHFPPTPASADNLRREGVADETNIVTGNTVVDAVVWVKDRLPAEPPAPLPAELNDGLRLSLVTCHRRESFGAPLESICEGLLRLVNKVNDLRLVLPVHPNPMVQQVVKSRLAGHPRIVLMEPLDYVPLLWCMHHSALILTDSGGIQEEAPSFGKPVLILRESTERPEVVHAGFAELVGTDADRIFERALHYLSNPAASASLASRPSPFGDGSAGRIIAESLVNASRAAA